MSDGVTGTEGSQRLGSKPGIWFARALALLSLRRKKAPGTQARAAPSVSHDPWSENRAVLATVGDEMLAHCRRASRPLSIIVLDQSDFPELKRVFGSEVARQMAAKFAEKLQTLAAPKGAAIRTDGATFTVLLPGVGRDRAQAALQHVLGIACSVELKVGEDEVVLASDFLIQTVGNEATSIEEVYGAMRKDIHHAQQQELSRKRHLSRERQPRSSKSAPVMDDDARFATAVRHEVTIPMPLGSR